MKSELQRRSNNREKVLERLKQRGHVGVTNEELITIGGFRYGARIFELRKEGWEIETSAGEGGLFRFILKGRSEVQTNLFQEC